MEIRVSVTDDLKDLIKARADELNISSPEYLRMLANLDISLQRYQHLVTYINVMYNRIVDLHKELGVYATPLQDVPIVKIDKNE